VGERRETEIKEDGRRCAAAAKFIRERVGVRALTGSSVVSVTARPRWKNWGNGLSLYLRNRTELEIGETAMGTWGLEEVR
jgi:hypothetical protein